MIASARRAVVVASVVVGLIAACSREPAAESRGTGALEPPSVAAPSVAAPSVAPPSVAAPSVAAPSGAGPTAPATPTAVPAPSGGGTRDASAADLPPAMAAMLRDRPALAEALAVRTSLRAWMAARFRGEGLRFAIAWDPSTPASGQPGEHVHPQRTGDPGLLRLAAESTGVDQLAVATFELINAERAAEVDALWTRAVHGEVGRDALATGMTELEHLALRDFHGVAARFGLVPGDDDALLRRMLEAPADIAEFRRWIAALRGYDPDAYWRAAYDSAHRPGSAPH